MKTRHEDSFFSFMESVAARLDRLEKQRTAETYMSALKSFRRFVGRPKLSFSELDTDLTAAYEAYLIRRRGLAPNTSSFYMRILRAVYNRAVNKGLTAQNNPFRGVYTGVARTAKRAIPQQALRRIRDMQLPEGGPLAFARDMFLFSFYTRGMSFVDMAYLRKTDLKNGTLAYRRRKTGQLLQIRWEPCMQEILERHEATAESEFLLPIITDPSEGRRQYVQASHRINRNLKAIGTAAGLAAPLSMYVARHTWASIARSRHIPLSVISDGMGHDSEATTQIYLASIDNCEIDKANRLIIKSL